GLAQILTIQGTRRQISTLAGLLRDYLARTGGFVRGKLMEERITRYWLSDPNVERPPVIDEMTVF
ncbi:MAG: hypothetical protein AAFX02_07225, partial [Pseudomonadota bacterium]